MIVRGDFDIRIVGLRGGEGKIGSCYQRRGDRRRVVAVVVGVGGEVVVFVIATATRTTRRIH